MKAIRLYRVVYLELLLPTDLKTHNCFSAKFRDLMEQYLRSFEHITLKQGKVDNGCSLTGLYQNLKHTVQGFIIFLFLRKESFGQGEVDHLFSALVLPYFTYGLPVYGAVDSDLTDIQNFLDSSLPADVPWGLLLLVTHSFLPSLADVRGEK